MYQTARRTYYSPTMDPDIYDTVARCLSYSRQTAKAEYRADPSLLFPATRPMQDIEMDVLCPFLRTRHGQKHLLIIKTGSQS